MKSVWIIIAACCCITPLFSQTTDSIPTYELGAVEVSAGRIAFGRMDVPMRKEGLEKVLDNAGFELVRRGVFFAQDIAADGFRRGDIVVAVDGERYHSACPNRMDSPLTRVNPLDLDVVTLDKSATRAVSGFGGSVHFRRRRPADAWRMHASLAGSAGASESADAALLLEGARHALSLRLASGNTYEDGDGRSFSDLYGYSSLPAYLLAEGTLRGEAGDWKYGGGFSYTEDVVFPYLLMDERFNRVTNAHLQWKDVRAYVTYTDHLMTNDFRGSPTIMTTAARNLTAGVTGYNTEVWLRRWDSDNEFVMPTGMRIENHLMPEAQQLYAAHSRSFVVGPFTAGVRAGMSYQWIGDEDRLDFYRAVHADAENGQLHAAAALDLQWRRRLSSHSGYGLQFEAAAEPPGTEELFIAVRKPGDKPAWSGNPTLSQPLRGTLRASARFHGLQVEVSGSAVNSYVLPVKVVSAEGKYQTFGNTDAWLAAANVRYDAEYLHADLAWTWGEHRDGATPLSEIPPLRGSIMLLSPPWQNFILRGGVTIQADQHRVDRALAEYATAGWARLDAGLRWIGGIVDVDLTVENLLNRSYRQHLSYLRNPFAASMQVWEPGRIIRLQLHVASPL